MDVIIPAVNPARLEPVLSELAKTTRPPFRLIVQCDSVSAAINRQRGLDCGDSEFVAMADDDIRHIPDGWNISMAKALRENPDICGVSARLMDVEGKPAPNTADNFDLAPPLVKVSGIPTAFCLFRRPRFSKFDPRYLGSGWEDTDFFRQLCREYSASVAICNDVKVVHHNEQKEQHWLQYNKRLFDIKWRDGV